MEYITHMQTPLGPVTIAGEGDAITGLWFDGQKYYGATLSSSDQEGHLPVFEDVKEWLDQYFLGIQPDFTPPLAPRGTPFRQEVWQILLAIPYGKTMTYGEIAGQLAEKRGIASMSAQAVGGAVGHNPISLIIPCHRVVGADGNLTGYAGGLDRKLALLQLEENSGVNGDGSNNV